MRGFSFRCATRTRSGRYGAMSYRDDNDAARARADALQCDLDEVREELAATKMKLKASEHDRTDLIEKIAHVPPPSPVPIPQEPVEPTLPPKAEPQMGFGGFVFCLVALVILTWLRAQLPHHR